ncbi:unnamed protein product [Natator depressus]
MRKGVPVHLLPCGHNHLQHLPAPHEEEAQDVDHCQKDGKETLVKELFPGDTVHSLRSILDVITAPALPLHLLLASWPHPSRPTPLPSSEMRVGVLHDRSIFLLF